MRLRPDEPAADGWTPSSPDDVLAALVRRVPRPANRPWVIAVDGRSASGKTTIAAQLAAASGRGAVVHADDLAWHEPMFGWERLLIQVLELCRSGQGVFLRPPAWEAKGREGQVMVPPSAATIVVEGVGSSQRAGAHLLDAAVWVQSDADEAERRGIERDVASGVNGSPEESIAFWHEWDRHETEFLSRDRPWERADLIVAGTTPPGAQPLEGQLWATPGPLLDGERFVCS